METSTRKKSFLKLPTTTCLFSRNVFALETFFPIAEAFHEKYEPDGSTYSIIKIRVMHKSSGK